MATLGESQRGRKRRAAAASRVRVGEGVVQQVEALREVEAGQVEREVNHRR